MKEHIANNEIACESLMAELYAEIELVLDRKRLERVCSLRVPSPAIVCSNGNRFNF